MTLGEGANIEFKRKVPRPSRMAKEIIAFANTHGGHLLLGVGDDGAIVGVRDAGEEEYALQQVLQEYIQPAVRVHVNRVEISRRRDVIVVEVPASGEKPHFLVVHGNGHSVQTAYIRVEDMSVEASREHVRLMRAERSPRDVRFEFGEKEHLLLRYLEQYGQITVPQFATLADIPKRRASQTLVLLTRARVLTLHAHPRQDYFTLCYHFSS